MPRDVGKAFKWEPLKHLWEEYADTLHELRKAGSGAVTLVEVRATVPAEAMFTRECLVDGRMFDDFTKHLPGILTGLGIIGTFAGLLGGLREFKPTPIEAAVNGLGPLLHGVQHAFVVSAIAIGCAMFVVIISRSVLACFYQKVEQLTHGIDSLYSTGAGEEYLSRLVKSSEQNAASTAQLKDALVEDLNKMMTNLVERQIAAQEAASVALGQHIGERISDAIAEPMRKLGEAMTVTAEGNGVQVNSMLETLLAGFMAKLEDTFGGQMQSINDQMRQSTELMATVQASLHGLLKGITETNEQTANRMSGTLEDAMQKSADNQKQLTDQMREFVQDFRKLITEEQNKSKRAMDEAVMKVLGEVSIGMTGLEELRKNAATEEAVRNERLATHTTETANRVSGTLENAMQKSADNQKQLTDQMREFVQDFRKLITEEQNKSKRAMDETVMKVLGEVSIAMTSLEELRKNAATEETARNGRFVAHTTELVGGLGAQVESLLRAVSEQVAKTQKNVETLGQVSLQAIDGMNQGAITMGSAAQKFETAGNTISTVFDRSTKVTETLANTSRSLQTASDAVQRVVGQYESMHNIVGAQVATLMGLIESAKKEAGVSRELVADIEATATAMRESAAKSREHIDSVNGALIKAFTDFGNALVSQVKSAIAETDRHFGVGTGHLNGVVQELAQLVHRMKGT